MLDSKRFGAVAALEGARQARSDPIAAEKAVLEALALAPTDLEIRLAAYRYYFYSHRIREALPHAEEILRHAARRLNISSDWRAVQAGHVAFGEFEEAPGLYLQTLLAWGYCQARLGEDHEACCALDKVIELDPDDRFGARRLLAVIKAGDGVEEV